jgi:hypothetical protein
VIINEVGIILLQLNEHLKTEMDYKWDDLNVIAACPITISIDGSHVTAVCQNNNPTKCQNGNHRHQSSPLHNCIQFYYKHKYGSVPVGCVYASCKSDEAKMQQINRVH